MKTFYLVRHGQTDWNKERRLQGAKDIPLNAEGFLQAKSLQNFFIHHPVQAWFASPMARAQKTLEIACSPPKIVIEPDLGEVKLGPLEGRLHDEVVLEFGKEAWLTWLEFPAGSDDFSFAGAESARQSNLRFRKALVKLAVEHDFQAAALCTHGFLLRRFLQELSPTNPSRLIPNGFIIEVAVDSASKTFELKQTLLLPA